MGTLRLQTASYTLGIPDLTEGWARLCDVPTVLWCSVPSLLNQDPHGPTRACTLALSWLEAMDLNFQRDQNMTCGPHTEACQLGETARGGQMHCAHISWGRLLLSPHIDKSQGLRLPLVPK